MAIEIRGQPDPATRVAHLEAWVEAFRETLSKFRRTEVPQRLNELLKKYFERVTLSERRWLPRVEGPLPNCKSLCW
jgi:anti-sigma factor RsiW